MKMSACKCTYLKMIMPVFNKKAAINIRGTSLLLTSVLSRKSAILGTKLSCVGYLNYSNKSKQFLNLDKKEKSLNDAFEHRKEIFKDTETALRQKGEIFVRNFKHQREVTGQRLRERKDGFVKDLLETKAKVKERIEEVVEQENVFTIPNILCFTRIALSPVLAFFILTESYSLALGVFAFAGVTDLLDGWIARTWKSQSSRLGSFLDPMADKFLIAPMCIALTIQNLIPLGVTLLFVARDVAIMSTVTVMRYRSLPEPKKISKFFDMSHASAQLSPTTVSKYNTALQLVFVATTLSAPVFGFVDHPALQALCGITAATTVASAISYLVIRDTYKMFRKK